MSSYHDQLDDDAQRCRTLFATVVLHALNDWWGQIGKPWYDRDRAHAEALRYFRSRDGREVVFLAGITADPEQLAAAAVDPDARERTVIREAQRQEYHNRQRVRRRAGVPA